MNRPARSFNGDHYSEHYSELGKVVVEASNRSRKALAKARMSAANFDFAQLRLSDLKKLHGREADMMLLEDKLASISSISTTVKRKRELILVAGVSGVGKSALVARGLEQPAKNRGMVFVQGKFDLNNNNALRLPYSAFAHALSELAKHVKVQPNAMEIKSDIQEALGREDMAMISSTIPGCEDFFFSLDMDASTDQNGGGGSGKAAVDRLKYALRRLMKAVCANMKQGVVMFIDDLQWSDSSSLDLLQSLVQDDHISSFMLVGAYRNDEVPDSHPLALHIKEAERLGSTVTTINLGNLDSSSCQSLVAEALNSEDEDSLAKVKSLAAIIHKKTEGNPFFVIFFLRSLYDDELLQYNFVLMSWKWDDEKINEKCMTQNVASTIITKLRRFNKSAQSLIKVASCIGSTFSTKVIATIFEKSRNVNDLLADTETVDSCTISDSISLLESEGIFERDDLDDDETYKFSHDQIQSASSELIPIERRESFKGSIGGVLMKALDRDTFDKYLFDIVSLRNCASSTSLSYDEQIDLAYLNVQAGLKASKKAAFDTSVVYFEAARNLFGSNAWSKRDGKIDSNILIELYNKEAQARFVVGDLNTTEMLVEELLSKSLSIKQVFEAYEVKILAAQAANRFDEAISVALEVRRLLGFKSIPTNVSKITVLREFRKTNKAVKGRNAEELAALPTLTDERVAMGQRMLELLCTSTYQGNPPMFPLISFRAVRDTIKYGINRSSCDGLVTYGVLLTGAFGDPVRGREMGRAAELILEQKPGMKTMKSRVTFHVQGINYHNTSPLIGTLGPMLEGYQSGLETGDTESACWNLCFRSCYLWFASCPLEDISCELRTNMDVLNQMNQVGTMMCVLPYYQAAKNLCGESVSDCPWLLSGEDFDFEQALDFAQNVAKNQMLRAFIIVGQLDLLVIYQQWNDAGELLIKAGDLRLVMPGFFQAVRFTFLEGLISLKTAQMAASRREKRKWSTRAKKSMHIIKVWLEKGNVNLVHALHLLTAEYHILNKKPEAAEQHFKKAISIATRAGFAQDRALAHELAALYYMKLGDDYWTEYNMKSAHTAYMDWQAKAKAGHLKSKYPHLNLGNEDSASGL